MKSMQLFFDGLEMYLLADRAVWIPSHDSLFVADTHFGKATTFRQMGVSVPAGTTEVMLQRLDKLLAETNVRRLIVLGDWIHHSKTAKRDYIDELTAWRDRWSDLEITCVEGNHDRYNRRLLKQLSIELVDDQTHLGRLLLCHYPQDDWRSSRSAEGRGVLPSVQIIQDGSLTLTSVSGEPLRLCGHLHPGVKLPIAPKLQQSFPCFVVGDSQIILPAFGEFTGLAKVSSTSGWQLIACVSDQLIVVPEAVEQLF